MKFDSNTEYTGKISSMITVDENGNPTRQAKINTDENSFNVTVHVQFFNLIPDTAYQYLLEVDKAWDEAKLIDDKGISETKIQDVQLRATSQIIQLEKENLNEKLRVSVNGYSAAGDIKIDRVPIYNNDNLRTYKVKITFGAIANSDKESNKKVDWQIAETFISIPENSYRPNLPIPGPISPFAN